TNDDAVGGEQPGDDVVVDDAFGGEAGAGSGSDADDAAADGGDVRGPELGDLDAGDPDAGDLDDPALGDGAARDAASEPVTDDASVAVSDSGPVVDAGADASSAPALPEAGEPEPRTIFVGNGPSCGKLQPICGPDANEHCCEVFEVEGGQFTRGDNEGWSAERPEHPASVDAFWLDRYEVSVGRF